MKACTMALGRASGRSPTADSTDLPTPTPSTHRRYHVMAQASSINTFPGALWQ